MGFLYDPKSDNLKEFNTETIHISRLQSGYWSDKLLEIIKQHVRETNSELARRLENDWLLEIENFWHVVPLEILQTLEQPINNGNIKGKIA